MRLQERQFVSQKLGNVNQEISFMIRLVPIPTRNQTLDGKSGVSWRGRMLRKRELIETEGNCIVLNNM